MKLVKFFLVLCLTAYATHTGWAQKKEIVRGAVNAAGNVARADLLRGSSPSVLVAHTHLFMQTHGRLPKRTLYANKHPISTYDMNEEQLWEVRLARQAYFQIKNAPAARDRDLEELAALYEQKPVYPPMPSEEDFLAMLEDWMQAHHGFRPRLNIYRNGEQVPADELRQEPELYEEHTLARRLNQMLYHGVKNKEVRDRLAEIAKTPTVTRWENPKENQFYDGFKNPLPSQYVLVEQLQTWVDAHDGKRPRGAFYAEHNKYRTVDQLTPQEYEEYTLASRLTFILRKGHLEREVRRQLEHIYSLPIWHPEAENR